MAKHEHMSSTGALTHAAMIGHLLRGTVLEGKSFEEAHDAARRSVGPAVDTHMRQDVTSGPMLDEAHYPRR